MRGVAALSESVGSSDAGPPEQHPQTGGLEPSHIGTAGFLKRRLRYPCARLPSSSSRSRLGETELPFPGTRDGRESAHARLRPLLSSCAHLGAVCARLAACLRRKRSGSMVGALPRVLPSLSRRLATARARRCSELPSGSRRRTSRCVGLGSAIVGPRHLRERRASSAPSLAASS